MWGREQIEKKILIHKSIYLKIIQKENKHYNELKSSTETKMVEFEGYGFLHLHNKFSKLFHKNLRFITEIMSESNNTEN